MKPCSMKSSMACESCLNVPPELTDDVLVSCWGCSTGFNWDHILAWILIRLHVLSWDLSCAVSSMLLLGNLISLSSRTAVFVGWMMSCNGSLIKLMAEPVVSIARPSLVMSASVWEDVKTYTSFDSWCQVDGIVMSLGDKEIVSMKSSKETWNWEDTKPVLEFSPRYTLRAQEGDGPRLTPWLALGAHFGIVLPPCKAFCMAKTEHPKVCLSYILAPTSVFTKLCRCDVPSGWDGTVLFRWITFLSA